MSASSRSSTTGTSGVIWYMASSSRRTKYPSLNYGETGNLNFTKLEHLVRELCNLRNRGMDVCLVSSGAIAVGRQTLGMDERPKDISTKQACAAVGQARLMMIYQRLFAEYNQVAGQVLMTKNTMVNPVSRENAKKYVRRIVPSWHQSQL